MKAFIEMLDDAIKAKGITLERLAKRINSHKGYISGMRRGRVNPPSAKFVRRLARELDLPYPVLMLAAEVAKIHPDVRETVENSLKVVEDLSKTKFAVTPTVSAKA